MNKFKLSVIYFCLFYWSDRACWAKKSVSELMNDNEQMGGVIIFTAKHEGQHFFQAVIDLLLVDKNHFFPRKIISLKLKISLSPPMPPKMILDLVTLGPFFRL